MDNSHSLELAQTYPQLMNQLSSLGYCIADREKVKIAFNIALQFSDGLYRAQGVPLINHLIRTASILAREKQPIDIILAGLLHAAFLLHKFDLSMRSAKPQKKYQYITEKLSQHVADIVNAYASLNWHTKNAIKRYYNHLDQVSPQKKQLITIQLANELEDNLDFAMLYSSDNRIALRHNSYLNECCILAEKLRLPFIHSQLTELQQQIENTVIPKQLLTGKKQGYEMPIIPLWTRSLGEHLRYFLSKIKNLTYGKPFIIP